MSLDMVGLKDKRAVKNTSNKRRLPVPPFAAQLAKMRRRGLVPARTPIVVELNWERASNGPHSLPTVLCPPDAPPSNYDWGFVAGLDTVTMVGDQEFERGLEVAAALHRAKAASLVLFNYGSDPHSTTLVVLA
jgi:hypothetical protein